MNARPEMDFKRMLAREGIPTTAEAMAVELEKEVVAAGSQISNDSRMSPFWRLVKAIVISPALWLVERLLAGHVLPNTFAATAKGRYLDLKAWEVDLVRKEATKTRGAITFFKSSPKNPLVVPKGTVVETEPIEKTIYRLVVAEDVLIPEGQAQGLVICEAEHPGSGFNLPAGYYSLMPIGVSGIRHAVNEVDWITTLGADRESDEGLSLRIRNQFSVVGRYHIDAIYRSMLAAVAGIRSDQVYFLHEAPRGPGTANAYLLMEVGPTPSRLLNQLNDYVMAEGHHGHGDDLLCLALPETLHRVRLEVWAKPNVSEAQQQQLRVVIENMVRAAFRESDSYHQVTRTYPKSTFSFSKLIEEIHAELNESLLSLRFDNHDIVSALEIPRLSEVVVTYG
ncbi:baseplate J/gp47 family protein [Vibrio sp. VNB-15]